MLSSCRGQEPMAQDTYKNFLYDDFSYYSISPAFIEFISQVIPFSQIRNSKMAETDFRKVSGMVKTSFPLILLTTVLGSHLCVEYYLLCLNLGIDALLFWCENRVELRMSPLSELDVPVHKVSRSSEEGLHRQNNKITAWGEALMVFVTCFYSLETVPAATSSLLRPDFSADQKQEV